MEMEEIEKIKKEMEVMKTKRTSILAEESPLLKSIAWFISWTDSLYKKLKK